MHSSKLHITVSFVGESFTDDKLIPRTKGYTESESVYMSWRHNEFLVCLFSQTYFSMFHRRVIDNWK